MNARETHEMARTLSRITAFSRRAGQPAPPRPSVEEWLASTNGGEPDGHGTSSVEVALVAQLGRPFAGASRETPVRRLLLAILAERCVENGDAMNMLARFVDATLSCEGTIGRESEARILGSSSVSARDEILLEVAGRHHYSNTVILELLDMTGRRGRALAPALLMSFRAHDAFLWRLIDSAGRPDLSPDTAMAVSHWRDEKLMGGPLVEPFTGHLVSSLRERVGSH